MAMLVETFAMRFLGYSFLGLFNAFTIERLHFLNVKSFFELFLKNFSFLNIFNNYMISNLSNESLKRKRAFYFAMCISYFDPTLLGILLLMFLCLYPCKALNKITFALNTVI